MTDYEVGYQDGESSENADWVAAITDTDAWDWDADGADADEVTPRWTAHLIDKLTKDIADRDAAILRLTVDLERRAKEALVREQELRADTDLLGGKLDAARRRAAQVRIDHDQTVKGLVARAETAEAQRDRARATAVALEQELHEATRRRSIGGTPPGYTHNAGDTE